MLPGRPYFPRSRHENNTPRGGKEGKSHRRRSLVLEKEDVEKKRPGANAKSFGTLGLFFKAFHSMAGTTAEAGSISINHRSRSVSTCGEAPM